MRQLVLRHTLEATSATAARARSVVGRPVAVLPRPLTLGIMEPNHANRRGRLGASDDITQPLVIDGGMLESGGQILRMAAALSSITLTPIEVINIRAGRQRPGLRPQHLTGLELVTQVADASATGLQVGSTKITLSPSRERQPLATLTADTRTAGSCVLLAQAGLPCILFSGGGLQQPSEVKLKLLGGTDADMAPPIDYLKYVLLPLLRTHFGLRVSISVPRRGFYPTGGGQVELGIHPLPAGQLLPPLQLKARGDIVCVDIYAFCGGDEFSDVAERILLATADVLKRELPGVKQAVHLETDVQCKGKGSGVLLAARSQTGSVLGASARSTPKSSPEEVGREAAESLLEEIEHGGCVDRWMQDQLIIFMALAEGVSAITTGRLTLHTCTAIHLAQMMLNGASFSVRGGDGQEYDGPDVGFKVAEAIGKSSGDEMRGTWLIECTSPGWSGAWGR